MILTLLKCRSVLVCPPHTAWPAVADTPSPGLPVMKPGYRGGNLVFADHRPASAAGAAAFYREKGTTMHNVICARHRDAFCRQATVGNGVAALHQALARGRRPLHLSSSTLTGRLAAFPGAIHSHWRLSQPAALLVLLATLMIFTWQLGAVHGHMRRMSK